MKNNVSEEDLPYGKISKNTSINKRIYSCFEYLSDTDVNSFMKKFKDQPEPNVMHTFRELLFGAYLSSRGFNVIYELQINSKTPDWCVVDGARNPVAVIDVVNFHIDRNTEKDIERQTEEYSSAAYWIDENKNSLRLYQRLKDKITQYKEIVKNNKLAYVVCLFQDFLVDVEEKQIRDLLFNNDSLFADHDYVSGLLASRNDGKYFRYYENPVACHPFPTLEGGF